MYIEDVSAKSLVCVMVNEPPEIIYTCHSYTIVHVYLLYTSQLNTDISAQDIESGSPRFNLWQVTIFQAHMLSKLEFFSYIFFFNK